ncbi:F-box/LRR-repeat protein 18-like [Glandiceps talaboti]
MATRRRFVSTHSKSSLSDFPDELLLKILSYSRVCDILSIAQTCRKLHKLSRDTTLYRHIDISQEHGISEKRIASLLRIHKGVLQTFSMEHCYWIDFDKMSFSYSCKTMTELGLTGCDVSVSQLVICLSYCFNIQSLSWDDSFSIFMRPLEFFQMFNNTSKKVLSKLHELKLGLAGLNVAVSIFFVDDANHYSILYFCQQLRRLHLEEIPMCLGHRTPSHYWNTSNLLLQLPKLEMVTVMNTTSAWFPPRGTLLGIFRAIPLDNNLSVVSLPNALVPRASPDKVPTARAWKEIIFPRLKGVKQLDVRGISNVHADAAGADLTAELQLMLPSSLLSYQWSGSGRKQNTESYTHMFHTLARSCSELKTFTIEDAGEVFPYGCKPPSVIDIDQVAEYCQNLRHLNLNGTHYECSLYEKRRVATSIAKMKGLKSLSLPSCLIGTGKSSIQVSTFNTSQSDEEVGVALPSPLEIITDGCQCLEEFELIADYFGTGGLFKKSADLVIFAGKCDHLFATVSEDLTAIAKWKLLKKLTMAGLIGVTNGDILVAIAANCKALKSLSVAYFGQYKQQCVYQEALIKALQLCENLKELRIEQPNLKICDELLTSINTGAISKSIENVCIINRDARLTGDLCTLVGNCPNLLSCIVFCDEDFERCRQVWQEILNRYKRRRQALYVLIHPRQLDIKYSQRTLSEIPRCFVDKMLHFRSRVGELPL